MYLLSAILVVVAVHHLALLPKGSHILPPVPGLPSVIAKLPHAQLAEIFLQVGGQSQALELHDLHNRELGCADSRDTAGKD